MKQKNIKNTKLHVGAVALKSARHKGITLMALIITIVIMLILATVTIGAINGGLFSYAGKAKTGAEEATIIEGIQKAYILAKGESNTNWVTEAQMQKQVDSILTNTQAVVVQEGDLLIVQIGEKYYEVASNGKVTGPKAFEKIEYVGDITKGGTCTGTQANPYRIECIEDLVKLSAMAYNKETTNTSRYYLLTKDLDFNSIFSYANYKTKYSYNEEKNAYIPDDSSQTTIKELCTTGKGFIPIGLDYDSGRYFKGIFEGNNHHIKNIYINTVNNAALFGGANGANIKNLTISGNIIATGGRAVGFVAEAWVIQLNKCYNKAKIESKNGSAAGIFGNGQSNKITECGNEGEIIANGDIAAGVALEGNTGMNKCYNKGNITNYKAGLRSAVGICGNPRSGAFILKNCYNTGNIISQKQGASGITSWFGGTIYNCYTKGDITGSESRYVARNRAVTMELFCNLCKLWSFWQTTALTVEA